jgi:hypothetical protein
MDKGKVDHRLDLANQVILRNQTLERHHLKFGLLRQRFLQHDTLNQKSPQKARTLSAVWGRQLRRPYSVSLIARSRIRGA